MLSLVYQHLFARHCSLLGVHALSSISTYVCQALGCMLSPVYQHLFARRCSILGMHALSSISTYVCQALGCMLFQYINICLPDVAPYLGCMLSPLYQHLFARRCSILRMHALSSILTSVCQALLHTWDVCSLQYINICLPGVAPYLGCMLSPVYQYLFARLCAILGMHALSSISTSVCQALLHTWDACSLQYINICLPGVGMHALSSISMSVCQTLLHAWDACSLQYINISHSVLPLHAHDRFELAPVHRMKLNVTHMILQYTPCFSPHQQYGQNYCTVYLALDVYMVILPSKVYV